MFAVPYTLHTCARIKTTPPREKVKKHRCARKKLHLPHCPRSRIDLPYIRLVAMRKKSLAQEATPILSPQMYEDAQNRQAEPQRADTSTWPRRALGYKPEFVSARDISEISRPLGHCRTGGTAAADAFWLLLDSPLPVPGGLFVTIYIYIYCARGRGFENRIWMSHFVSSARARATHCCGGY